MKKQTVYLSIGLLVAEVVLILVSWLVTAAVPEPPMRSLISSEGIRWLFGSIADNLLSPLMVWLLLGSMATGAVQSSGLAGLCRPLTYRQRFALRVVMLEVAVAVVALLLLTMIPHAVLLSVTGHLFPSSFSDSFVSIFCLLVMVIALSYAFLAGTITKLPDAIDVLTDGIGRYAWLWPLYILGAELLASIRFVFE